MRHIEHRLTGEFIELNKLLKLTGVCPSGGAAKALVASGGAAVNGAVETRKTCKIRAGQTVSVADLRISVQGVPPAP